MGGWTGPNMGVIAAGKLQHPRLLVVGSVDPRTSDDMGGSWTNQTDLSGGATRAATWDATRGLFLVGQASDTINTSPDGVTFTARDGGQVTATWWGVACSPTVCVAVDVAGKVSTSSDGFTWTAASPVASAVFVDLIYAPELGLFLASDASGRIFTSPGTDGTTWTQRFTTAAVWAVNSIAWAADWSGGYAFAVGSGGHWATSSDGINWSDQSVISGTPTLNRMRYNPATGLMLAVGGSGEMRRTNQSGPWVEPGTPSFGADNILSVAAIPNGRFLATGGSGKVAISDTAAEVFTQQTTGMASSDVYGAAVSSIPFV